MKSFNFYSYYDRTKVERVLDEAKEALERFEKVIGEEAEGDVTLRFMDAGLYVESEKLVGTIWKLFALKKVLSDEYMPVNVMLDYSYVTLRWSWLVKNFIKVLRDHILPCRPVMDRNKDCASEEAVESEFVKSVEMDCVNESVGEEEEMMQILHQQSIRFIESVGELIEEIGMLDSSFLYGDVCDYVTYYARSERKQEEKRLKMQAQKMKRERYEVLSDKHWCEVLESEERVMKLAGEGKMESAAEESYDECDKDMCRAMEENRVLIREMMQIWTDDELFDMEQLLSENCCIMGLLTVDNIGLFARLVLRGNIIRSKMNEELRRKFEAWIGDEEKEGEEKGEKGSADEGKRGDEEGKGVLMSRSVMKEWRKLQEKGWIDENLQPTTNMQMAAVIASVLGEKLKLKPKWAAFESLWGMKGLATRLTRALSGSSGKRYCDFQKEVEKALGMSHKRD